MKKDVDFGKGVHVWILMTSIPPEDNHLKRELSTRSVLGVGVGIERVRMTE